MGLVNRLAGIPEPGQTPEEVRKLEVNTFHASMYELAAGQVTKAQIVSYFGLDAAEQSELDWIISQYNAQPNAAAREKYVELLRVCFIMAEAQVPGYTTNAQLALRLAA